MSDRNDEATVNSSTETRNNAAPKPAARRDPDSRELVNERDRKRIKRIGFGFRNFENYRIRALLYAGKPNWRVLGSIVVR